MVIQLDLSKTPKDELASHDRMMVDAAIKLENISRLSLALWSAVLKEMSSRGMVTLVSGSLDNVGSAHLVRNYDLTG